MTKGSFCSRPTRIEVVPCEIRHNDMLYFTSCEHSLAWCEIILAKALFFRMFIKHNALVLLEINKLSLDIRIETLENMTATLRSKQTYLENQSRRNNLRVNSIPENGYESSDKVEVKLKRVLVKQLNLDYEPEIERAHRVGKMTKLDGSPLDKPRTIVAKFYDWKV